MTDAQEQFDVVVVGGGPGGSTLATFVAMAGYSVLLLEKEQFPRYQLGESLLPPTLGLCHRLGLGTVLEHAGFTPKNGGVWYWGTDDEPGWGFDFDELPKAPLYGNVWAYQVERSKFDELLIRNAQAHGVVVREQHRVTAIMKDDDRVVGVEYIDRNGATRSVRSTFVGDAGGHASPFHRIVGRRVFANSFRNLALHCYYAGGDRLPPPQSGSILNVSFADGWFWYIPLASELTSLGAVVPIDRAPLLKNGRGPLMDAFINSCPLIKSYLGDAPRVTTGQYGQYRVRRDWSYANSRFWIPGMLLVGDAACFVDPLFSSGVHLATYSAFLGARSILTSLRTPSLERRAFEAFETTYRREYRHFYDYLMFFYDKHHTREEYFRHARDILGTTEAAKEAFVRLVGGFGTAESSLVAGTGGPTANHFDGSLKRNSKPASPPRVIDSAPGSRDVARLFAGTSPAAPIGGLVSSDDGLSWVDVKGS